MAEQRTLNKALIRRTVMVFAGISLVIMMFAAHGQNRPLVSAGAVLFAFAVSIGAVASNFESWRLPATLNPRAIAIRTYFAIQRNALLAAIAYAWGAAAMQGLHITPITGLWWQHCWVYAIAMLLLAAGNLAFSRTLPIPRRTERDGWDKLHYRVAWPLAFAQGAVAVGGLAYLALSGKLAADKVDWAANRIFAALAVAILAVSFATLVSLSRARAT
ncbi:MAG: hypothetical protein ACK5JT_09540 [Hyphomicrobiaceae bacterium]